MILGFIILVESLYIITTVSKKQAAPITPPPTEPVFCTADAMLCPDGSSVGRVAPNCDFSPCPKAETPKPDNTANWKTYTNSSGGYKFSYPNNLDIEQKDEEVIVWQDKNRPTQPLIHLNPAIYFTVTSENITSTIEDWSKNLTLPGTVKSMKIGNQPVYYFNGDGVGEGTFNYVFVNDKTLVRVFTLESEKTFNNDPIFAQILSTFKFTE